MRCSVCVCVCVRCSADGLPYVHGRCCFHRHTKFSFTAPRKIAGFCYGTMRLLLLLLRRRWLLLPMLVLGWRCVSCCCVKDGLPAIPLTSQSRFRFAQFLLLDQQNFAYYTIQCSILYVCNVIRYDGTVSRVRVRVLVRSFSVFRTKSSAKQQTYYICHTHTHNE